FGARKALWIQQRIGGGRVGTCAKGPEQLVKGQHPPAEIGCGPQAEPAACVEFRTCTSGRQTAPAHAKPVFPKRCADRDEPLQQLAVGYLPMVQAETAAKRELAN